MFRRHITDYNSLMCDYLVVGRLSKSCALPKPSDPQIETVLKAPTSSGNVGYIPTQIHKAHNHVGIVQKVCVV